MPLLCSEPEPADVIWHPNTQNSLSEETTEQ